MFVFVLPRHFVNTHNECSAYFQLIGSHYGLKSMPGGVTYMTCVLRVDVQLTRENVWQANQTKFQIFQPSFFTLIKPPSLHMFGRLFMFHRLV